MLLKPPLAGVGTLLRCIACNRPSGVPPSNPKNLDPRRTHSTAQRGCTHASISPRPSKLHAGNRACRRDLFKPDEGGERDACVPGRCRSPPARAPGRPAAGRTGRPAAAHGKRQTRAPARAACSAPSPATAASLQCGTVITCRHER